jgi:hypothetical protein
LGRQEGVELLRVVLHDSPAVFPILLQRVESLKLPIMDTFGLAFWAATIVVASSSKRGHVSAWYSVVCGAIKSGNEAMRHRTEVGRLGGRSVGIKKRPEGTEEGHMEKRSVLAILQYISLKNVHTSHSMRFIHHHAFSEQNG